LATLALVRLRSFRSRLRSRGVHELIAAWDRLVKGPNPEEVEHHNVLRKQQDAVLRAKLAELMDRHATLVAHRANDKIVTVLLGRHSPHKQVSAGQAYCRGCPTGWDAEEDEYYQSWPCPVWATIDELNTEEPGCSPTFEVAGEQPGL
jgi:hypothetical protein